VRSAPPAGRPTPIGAVPTPIELGDVGNARLPLALPVADPPPRVYRHLPAVSLGR